MESTLCYQGSSVQILILPPICCVTLAKQLAFSSQWQA